MDAVRRRESIASQLVDGKAFLLAEGTTKMVVLNPVGTMVWEALDGERDVDAIADLLVGEFEDVTPSQLRDDIETFVAELRKVDFVF
jgi:hypothetical protein